MKTPIQRHLKLNTKLLPILIGLLLIMQLTYPYKGWQILLLGLGGVWLISYLWARALTRHLSFSREMRYGWAHVGDRLEERFTVTNMSLIPATWLEIVDHTTMPGYAASRVTGVDGRSLNRWHTQGVCTRRGIYTLGPTTLLTGDPFGLYTVSLRQSDSATLTVTPPIVPLPAIEVAPGGRAGLGRARLNAFERTVSVAGARSYIPGDSLHWIHWPTTARKGSLHVRLFDSLPSSDWWLLLDLDERVQVGEGSRSTQEHSVILTASLSDRGITAGRAVGLITYDEALVWLHPQRGDGQRREILRALAVAQPSVQSLAGLLSRVRPALGQMASLIIITAAVQDNWVETLLPLRQQGVVPTVLLLDPVSFGGTQPVAGLQNLLANFGITHHIINSRLLDRPESQPGEQGQWRWRVSPTGRAVAVQQPRDLQWKELA